MPGAAAALLLAAFFVAPSPAAALAPGCPQIVAHRGAPTAPENTVPAITDTPATGAQGVELDVQWSSSGFPVLMHDTTVDRTTNGTGTPGSLGLGQLTSLLAQDYAPFKTNPRFAATKVPYGADFMDAARDHDLDVVLDVHSAPTQLGTDKLEIYVNDYFDWAARTVVMASAGRVAQMNAWEPELLYAVIEYPPAERVYTPEFLRSIGAGAYAVPWGRITPGLVRFMHDGGLDVFAWTSDTDAQDVAANWLAMKAAGVDKLITNRPAEARAVLGCPAPSPSPSAPPTSTAPPSAPTATAPSGPTTPDPTEG
jgi:glycerophosphoryl diester phosphodiesterase